MLCLMVLVAPFYLGVVWLLTRSVCRKPEHRTAHLAAAAGSLPVAAFIGLCGLPYLSDVRGGAGILMALAVLLFGPAVFPLFRFRTAFAAGVAFVLLYAEPVIRAEYLTHTHGSELQHAFARASAGSARLFTVLSYSADRARALRVDDEDGGYYVDFVGAGGGAWQVRKGTYPPQVLAWYRGNSGESNCPYPVPVLLILHGVSGGCGL